MDLAMDVLRPDPTLARILLSLDEADGESAAPAVLRLLGLLRRLLTSDTLAAQIQRQSGQPGAAPPQLRQGFANMLEQILSFADTVRHQDSRT